MGQQVAMLRSMHSPRRLSEPRLDVALAEATTWEVICRLEGEGWRWNKMPRSVKARHALPPYMPGADRVFYSAGVDLDLTYLRALATADTLFAKGFQRILHWSADKKYYKKLLSGDLSVWEVAEPEQKKRRLQLDMDCDVLAEGAAQQGDGGTAAQPLQNAGQHNSSSDDGQAPHASFVKAPHTPPSYHPSRPGAMPERSCGEASMTIPHLDVFRPKHHV